MINPECHLYGEKFSPKLLKEIPNIKFGYIIECNDIGERGRFKNTKIPYGACSIKTPDNIELNRIEWMAEFVVKNKPEFKKAGATDITLWIYWEGIQGNMEFTVNELNKISETGVPLCIDYIKKN